MSGSDSDDREESLATAAVIPTQTKGAERPRIVRPALSPPEGSVTSAEMPPDRPSGFFPPLAKTTVSSFPSSTERRAGNPEMATGFTDEELIKLIDVNGGKYLRAAVSICYSKLDAEECVLNAKEKAFRKRTQYDSSRGTLHSWFVSIVVNVAKDLKRRRRRPEDFVVDMNEAINIEDAFFEKEKDSALEKALEKALCRLKENDAEALRLHFWGGLTNGEIAQKLGVTADVVDGRIRMGKEKLKKDPEIQRVWNEFMRRNRR